MGKELGFLEKLELLIPGFRGYKQKELMREDDRLVRNKASGMLDDARQEIERILPMIFEKHVGLVERVDDLRRDLMAVSQKIRHASHGYSGFFDRIKIREDELGSLLQADYKLITTAQEIRDIACSLRKYIGKEAELVEKINLLKLKLFDLDSAINERERMFKEEG